jgi:hypothetical protein
MAGPALELVLPQVAHQNIIIRTAEHIIALPGQVDSGIGDSLEALIY